MGLPKSGIDGRIPFLILVLVLAGATISFAEDFKMFSSEEYGFTMKYPATWVVEKPSGSYYVVFKAPDVSDTEGFRSRIHVAAHQPVKDPLSEFLKELRNGIAELQKTPAGGGEPQQVRILEEGEFACSVPGAYYFYLQAFEPKVNLWMDIVIVFYKHEQTLLRVSCLTPSKSIEKLQPVFNEALVSVKFGSKASAPSSREAQPTVTEERSSTSQPSPVATPALPPASPRSPGVEGTLPAPQPQVQPTPSPAAPPVRRGPSRDPDRPGTGIIN